MTATLTSEQIVRLGNGEPLASVMATSSETPEITATQTIAAIEPVTVESTTGQSTTAVESEPVSEVLSIPQPNADGEFSSPLEGALWMASWGISQIPLRPNSKIALLPEWDSLATADAKKIQSWWSEHPGCNFASVALDKYIIFETDSPDVANRFKLQDGKFTSRLMIVSTKGGHRYYLAVPGMTKTLAQNDTLHNDFSVRIANAYCVSPGSIHPVSGKQYRVLIDPTNNWPTAPTTPSQKEIDFWLSEKKSGVKNSPVASIDGPKIPRNSHDTELTRIAGRLRHDGLEVSAMKDALIEICEKRCVDYGDDYVSMCEKIAKSVCRYPVPKDDTVLIGGRVSGTAPAVQETHTVADSKLAFEIDTGEYASRPAFPHFVMEGTSLYEGLAKPVAAVNSKYPELIWLPAAQLMMNYLNDKVHIEMMILNLNIFLGLISPPGKFFKSSSCRLGHQYLAYAGLTDTYLPTMKNSEGKVIISQAGSSEGFGLRMFELNAKHAMMFNDELGKLAAKAGIENAALPQDLLSWYEGDEFGNEIKSKKQSFTFPAGSYCFGWQWATTTGGFNRHWAKIAGVVSGLEDRCFYLLTPEKPKPLVEETYVSFQAASLRTRQLVDKAVAKGTYLLTDRDSTREMAASFDDPRSMNMVYKFALYFAVDLDRDEVDEDCVERAYRLVKYRQQASQFLAPVEADNQQARIQQEMLRALRQNCGQLSYRELCRRMSSWRIGSFVWKSAYDGLIQAQDMLEFNAPGNRGQNKRMVGLRKWYEDD